MVPTPPIPGSMPGIKAPLRAGQNTSIIEPCPWEVLRNAGCFGLHKAKWASMPPQIALVIHRLDDVTAHTLVIQNQQRHVFRSLLWHKHVRQIIKDKPVILP